MFVGSCFPDDTHRNRSTENSHLHLGALTHHTHTIPALATFNQNALQCAQRAVCDAYTTLCAGANFTAHQICNRALAIDHKPILLAICKRKDTFNHAAALTSILYIALGVTMRIILVLIILTRTMIVHSCNICNLLNPDRIGQIIEHKKASCCIAPEHDQHGYPVTKTHESGVSAQLNNSLGENSKTNQKKGCKCAPAATQS